MRGAADGVIVQALDGRVVYANDCAARLIGVGSAAELLDAPLGSVAASFDMYDETGAPLDPEHLPGRALLCSKPARSEVVIRSIARGTGQLRWMTLAASPLFDEHGNVIAAVNTFWDITEQRRAEERQRFLNESGTLLSGSLDYRQTLQRLAHLAVPFLADWVGIYMRGDDGDIHALAFAHADPTKVALAESLSARYPLSKHSDGVHHVIETGEATLHEVITDAALQAAAFDSEHLATLRTLGFASAMLVPMTARGQVLGAVCLVAAETQRRFTRADLTFAEDLMRRAALAVDNARLYAEAQTSVRVRDEFLSIAGHELRTPLMALQVQIEMLHRQRGDHILVPRAKIARLVRQTRRLGQLTNELLDVSRIVGGRLTLQVEETDLTAIVREVCERLDEERLRRAVPALVVNAPHQVIGRWDPLRLEQIVTNLIGNANKYGQDKPIEISLACDGDMARLRVVDHGMGIAVADQARIFERFERAVPDRSVGGMGLGLWIVRQLVEAHGGTISVRSEVGQGAAFQVDLPGLSR